MDRSHRTQGRTILREGAPSCRKDGILARRCCPRLRPLRRTNERTHAGRGSWRLGEAVVHEASMRRVRMDRPSARGGNACTPIRSIREPFVLRSTLRHSRGHAGRGHTVTRTSKEAQDPLSLFPLFFSFCVDEGEGVRIDANVRLSDVDGKGRDLPPWTWATKRGRFDEAGRTARSPIATSRASRSLPSPSDPRRKRWSESAVLHLRRILPRRAIPRVASNVPSRASRWGLLRVCGSHRCCCCGCSSCDGRCLRPGWWWRLESSPFHRRKDVRIRIASEASTPSVRAIPGLAWLDGFGFGGGERSMGGWLDGNVVSFPFSFPFG